MLTARQRELVDFIGSYTKEHGGVAPSHEDICQHMGFVSKGAVTRLFRACEERGVLRWVRGRTRAVEVVKPERFAAFVFDDEAKCLVPLKRDERREASA
mgnify:CR=1 FL=1